MNKIIYFSLGECPHCLEVTKIINKSEKLKRDIVEISVKSGIGMNKLRNEYPDLNNFPALIFPGGNILIGEDVKNWVNMNSGSSESNMSTRIIVGVILAYAVWKFYMKPKKIQ